MTFPCDMVDMSIVDTEHGHGGYGHDGHGHGGHGHDGHGYCGHGGHGHCGHGHGGHGHKKVQIFICKYTYRHTNIGRNCKKRKDRYLNSTKYSDQMLS